MTTLQAIIHVLQQTSQPLHYKTILKEIQNQNLTDKLEGKTPAYSVNACITRHINQHQSSVFIRVSPWVYALTENIPPVLFEDELITQEQEQEIIQADEEPSETFMSINTMFIGKAWELAVCSELLLRWRNTNVLFVDDWIDLVALRKDRKIYIQVKMSTNPIQWSNQQTFNFSVWKKSFERYKNNSVAYVFVARTDEDTNTYVIFPYHTLNNYCMNGTISNWGVERYLIRISIKSDGHFYLGKENIDHLINNRHLIS